MSAIFISISAPLYYYLTKILFTAIGFGQICYYWTNSGLGKLSKEELDQLYPGKWFMRDLLVRFALSFYCLCILIDVYRLTPNGILSLSYLTSFIGDWCTSLVIVGQRHVNRSPIDHPYKCHENTNHSRVPQLSKAPIPTSK